MSRKLQLADIEDTRAYERERGEFRARVIDLKRKRRVEIGPFISVAFECRDTIRFQIQEMARVERISTDEGIEAELRAYNPLIPDPGSLSATLFLELTSDDLLREWLPKLVGIERSIELQIDGVDPVRFGPESGHEKQLTREETTAAVHYVVATLTPAQIEGLAANGATLAVTHDAYPHETELSADTVAELLVDLRDDPR